MSYSMERQKTTTYLPNSLPDTPPGSSPPVQQPNNLLPDPQLSPKTPITNTTVNLIRVPRHLQHNENSTCAAVISHIMCAWERSTPNAIYPPDPRLSMTSRDGVPPRNEGVVNGQLTKASNKRKPLAPPPPTPPLLSGVHRKKIGAVFRGWRCFKCPGIKLQ